MDFGDIYRRFAVEPNDDLIRRREGAVGDLAGGGVQRGMTLVRLACGLPGTPPSEIDSVKAGIQKHDAAFSLEANREELPVLAAAALLRILSKPDRRAVILSLALRCGLFGRAALHRLPELVSAAASCTSNYSRSLRRPPKRSAASLPVITDKDLESLQAAFKQGQMGPAGESVAALIGSLQCTAQSSKPGCYRALSCGNSTRGGIRSSLVDDL